MSWFGDPEQGSNSYPLPFLKIYLCILVRERESTHMHEYGEEGQKKMERETQTDSPLSTEYYMRLDLKTPRSDLSWKTRVWCLADCTTQASFEVFALRQAYVLVALWEARETTQTPWQHRLAELRGFPEAAELNI